MKSIYLGEIKRWAIKNTYLIEKQLTIYTKFEPYEPEGTIGFED